MIEKIEINLIPAEYVVRERHFSIDLSIVVPILLAIGIAIAALFWLSTVNSQIEREKETIAKLESQIEVNKRIQEEIRTLERKRTEMQIKVDGLKSINVNRGKWISALELYAEILPENTWLTGIEEAENEMITINGMTEADAEVGQFMTRLFEAPSVSGVNLLEMRDAGRNGQQKSFTVQHSFINTAEN
jgi:Tfp pilus assembly protein PilN